MAGLMGRTMLIIKSKYSKLLNRAENPTETLDYSYEQMLEQLQNVKRGVADVATAKKRLELQQQKLEQNVVKLETQARQARRREPRRPRDAGARAQGGRAAAAPGHGRAGASSSRTSRTSSSPREQQLETRIESFRSQKEVLKAQYSAAEAQVRVGEAATGIGSHMDDTGLAIQRAKDKTEELQARADAIDELTARGALEDFTAGDQTQLDRELAQISTSSRSTDELAKLKAEVGCGAASAEGDPGGRRRAPKPEPARRRSLRPQAAEAASRGEALRALDGRRDARHRVLAQAAGRVGADLQAAVGRRVHLHRERCGGAARGVARDSGSTLDRKTDSFGFSG